MAEPVQDFNEAVAAEPESSMPWLELIDQAERTFQRYQHHSNRIDKIYADMDYLAAGGRDREFALFWSTIEIEKPSVYARPPVPVVVPKFKDRRPVYRTSSEFLERSVNVGFDLSYIDDVMKLVRDDLLINARGVGWVRYESAADADEPTERVCIEWLYREDFLHEPTRSWPEVGWVSRRAWLTFEQMKKRFKDVPDAILRGAAFETRHREKNRGADDGEPKAGVWEIWHRGEQKVVWVSEGIPQILDQGSPHVKLQGFYPCPKPAYCTVKRGTLIPAADVLMYSDQLEEINELTARIHTLSGALQVRGFYPSGAGELGDAIESALAQSTNDKVLIGISNWAAFGGGAAKDSIVWLPTDMVSTTILQCVELRRQIIDDVYQIAGISDIQRGASEAEETATAQDIKQQNGSFRVRDKQNELIRFARDLVRISAEIMAEHFSQKTLLEMSQMELPTDAEIRKEVKALETEALRIQTEAKQIIAQAQEAQAPPEQIQQVQDAAEQEITKLGKDAAEKMETVTIDQVMKFLRDNKIRPFVLDIETDSTIYPDENAEKQRRAEFLTAFAAAMQQIGPMVAAAPESAPFAGEILRFALAPYRGGRVLDGSIDEFVEQMIARSQQPAPPNPEMLKIEQDGKFKDAEIQIKQQDLQLRQQELALKQQELQMAPQVEQAKEQIKVAGNVQSKQADAQAAVVREQAQLDADSQTNQQNLDAEAILAQQQEANENMRFAEEQQFKRDELAIDTRLAYDQLDQAAETARLNAAAKAKQPKGPSNV